MEHLLVVSASESSYHALAKFIESCNVSAKTTAAYSGTEARRLLGHQEFDIVVINAPLPDEFGNELSLHIMQQSIAGVVLIVKADISDAVAEKVEDAGVFVIPKPLNRTFFLQALRMLRTSTRRLSGLQQENLNLQKKLEDIRLVDRAKCILIESRKFSEKEAHAHIEQQAMQRRLTKRDIALEIIQEG